MGGFCMEGLKLNLCQPEQGPTLRGWGSSERGRCRSRDLERVSGAEPPAVAWTSAQGLPQKLLILGPSFLLPAQNRVCLGLRGNESLSEKTA